MDGRNTPRMAALCGRTVAAIQEMIREIAEDLPEQMTPDGQFPNVTKSPNPEVPESMDRAESLNKAAERRVA